MKLVKQKSLNEMLAEVETKDRGVVTPVYADAVRKMKERKDNFDKIVKPGKVEMPNEDRDAHAKVSSNKELKKMHLSESLFTEWIEDTTLTESFAQAQLVLDSDAYQLADNGDVLISTAFFNDYMEGSHINIQFLDNNDDKVMTYKMVAESPEWITMEYVGEAEPGIDEEIIDCQKYPVEKPWKAKDSQYISAKDKEPNDLAKAVNTGFVSAGDKQPNKAAMTEGILGNKYEFLIWLGDLASDNGPTIVEKVIQAEDSDAAYEKLTRMYAKKRGYEKEDLQEFSENNAWEDLWIDSDMSGGDPAVIGAMENGRIIEDVIEADAIGSDRISKRLVYKWFSPSDRDVLLDESINEAFTNWDSPESRVERYVTDLPELIDTMYDHFKRGNIEAQAFADALKIAYDTLDEVPHINEEVEASQKYPVETPFQAKDSQFISKEDKTPNDQVKAKDSQYISAGDKDPNKFNQSMKESVEDLQEGAPRKEGSTFLYFSERDPLGDVIQAELTEGEWGYVKSPEGKISLTRLPSANYLDDKVSASWDRNDRYAITVQGSSEEELQAAIDIANKYGKEYKLEKITRPLPGKEYCLYIYVDEVADFEEPYFDPNVAVRDGKKKKKVEDDFDESFELEEVESSQKYPVDFTETKALNEIRIETEGLSNFKPFGEKALETYNTIVSNGKLETLEFMLEDMYPSGIGYNELNTLLTEESEWLFKMLNITEDGEAVTAEAEVVATSTDDEFNMNID